MKTFIIFALLVFAASHLPSQESGVSRAQLLPYTGIYDMEKQKDVIVSLHSVGGSHVLVLTDLRNDNFRALFPAGKDLFIAGKELLKPEPVEYRIQFEWNNTGKIAKLRIHSAASNDQDQIGQKKNIRTSPIEFSNQDVTLKGDLYLPDRKPPYGAIILAHGSEDSDRYSFDALPFVLADRGLAVLAYDKRGTGESTGSWQDSGLEELAGDLLASLELLLRRNDIHKDNIGIIGFSEGGWVAPLAASRSTQIAYIVSISGGAYTKGYSFLHKYRSQFIEQGLTGEKLQQAMNEKEAIVAASQERVNKGTNPSGFDRRITYDPSVHWKEFKKPVLYLGGECDSLEPVKETAKRLEQIFISSNHPDFTIHIFSHAHHAMFLANTCRPSEFEKMEGISKFVPGYWDFLLMWIHSHAGL